MKINMSEEEMIENIKYNKIYVDEYYKKWVNEFPSYNEWLKQIKREEKLKELLQ